jgi:Uma2 family endonuclease
MATVTTKPMTAEGFYEWVHRPENRDRFFELERGEVVEMPPPHKYHGRVCAKVCCLLETYAAGVGKGYPVSNDSGFCLETNPDTVRGADVSFYEDDQTADTMDRKYTTRLPKLAVEVLSPSDSPNKVTKRVTQFLIRGIALVWVIDPEVRSVAVYHPAKLPRVLDEGDELDGNDVLPGFRCRVAEFFALPGKQP